MNVNHISASTTEHFNRTHTNRAFMKMLRKVPWGIFSAALHANLYTNSLILVDTCLENTSDGFYLFKVEMRKRA